MTNEVKITPITEQHKAMKAKHPDAILLFRVGDFYETFSNDAIAVSEICGVTLTRRANGKAASIELAGFPHHALDTYMPKLIRAGKRVAICEQLEKPDVKKTVIKDGITELSISDKNQPEPEPEPEKKMTVKEINCKLTTDQMRDLGEPIAYFTMTLPKEAKSLGKQTSKERASLEAVCVQPGRGKIIASETHILTAMDVKCDGVWPAESFECFIDAKAISALAGKEVDIAVWPDYRGNHHVTACEAAGVRSQYQLTNAKYPDWRRVMLADEGCNIIIAENALEPLRKFVKTNMGKTKKERENRFVVFEASKKADDVLVQIVEETEKYSGKYTAIAKEQFDIKSNYPEHDIRMAFNAALFYYSVQDDFNGSMWFRNECSAVKFNGTMRESILMPVCLYGEYEAYFK